MKRIAYEDWYVDDEGYAHDDEGHSWYVGLEEGHYRPGTIPSTDQPGAPRRRRRREREREWAWSPDDREEYYARVLKAYLALVYKNKASGSAMKLIRDMAGERSMPDPDNMEKLEKLERSYRSFIRKIPDVDVDWTSPPIKSSGPIYFNARKKDRFTKWLLDTFEVSMRPNGDDMQLLGPQTSGRQHPEPPGRFTGPMPPTRDEIIERLEEYLRINPDDREVIKLISQARSVGRLNHRQRKMLIERLEDAGVDAEMFKYSATRSLVHIANEISALEKLGH